LLQNQGSEDSVKRRLVDDLVHLFFLGVRLL